MSPPNTSSAFEILNFNYNPFVYEWAYFIHCIDSYQRKKDEYNNFLIELKRIPFYDVRLSLTNYASLFSKLYKDDPTIIKRFAQITDIEYKIIIYIIKKLLKLPNTITTDSINSDTSSKNDYQEYCNTLNELFIEKGTIKCMSAKMDTSKTKTLQALIKRENDLLNVSKK